MRANCSSVKGCSNAKYISLNKKVNEANGVRTKNRKKRKSKVMHSSTKKDNNTIKESVTNEVRDSKEKHNKRFIKQLNTKPKEQKSIKEPASHSKNEEVNVREQWLRTRNGLLPEDKSLSQINENDEMDLVSSESESNISVQKEVKFEEKIMNKCKPANDINGM